MKKFLAFAVVVGVLFGVPISRAANLTGAASTLPKNEEWSLMAYSSVGQNVGQDFLKTKIVDGSATDYEKRILAITSQGQNPRTFGQENFVEKLLNKFDGNQIGSSSLINDDIFALLALKSAGENSDVMRVIRNFVLANQNSDGGWSFNKGGSSDSNTTAMALAAINQSGGTIPTSGLNYLKAAQKSDGGFGYTKDATSDGASTAWAILGLRSSGQGVPNNALSFLESLQVGNGGFKWRAADANTSSLVTSYAVIALSGKNFPIRIVTVSQPSPSPSPTPVPSPTPAPTPSPTPSPLTYNNSQCVNITAPDVIAPNTWFYGAVTMRNSGTKTWTSDATPHRLGSQQPQDNVFWGLSRRNLPNEPIATNQSVTFTFDAKSPSIQGTYAFSWKMVEENTEWFGETCTRIISVQSAQPNPTPTPSPTPNPPPTGTFSHAVTISYPGNKIFVGSVPLNANAKAIDTLKWVANYMTLLHEIRQTSFGAFVYSIDGYIPQGSSGWQYAVNNTTPNVSASDFTLSSNESVQWFYGPPNIRPY